MCLRLWGRASAAHLQPACSTAGKLTSPSPAPFWHSRLPPTPTHLPTHPPATPTRPPHPTHPAGATSAAIKKSNSGLTQKLSGFASFAALALGATMLLGGFGVELPFSLPFLGGHDH